MKKLFPILLLLSFSLLLFNTSCKKTKTELPLPEDDAVSAILRSHSWKLDSVGFLQKGSLYLHIVMPNCVLDDKLDFLNGGYYVKGPGAMLCSGQLPKADTLGWKVINNQKQIQIVNNGITLTKDIIKVVADSFMTRETSPANDTFVYLFLRY